MSLKRGKMSGDGQKPESSSSSAAALTDSTSEHHKDNIRPVKPQQHASMYQAAFEGDWQAAQIVLQIDPNVVSKKITERDETALHVAVIAKQTKFVKKLVKKMKPEDLILPNKFGLTAFSVAASSGIVKIAAVMREKMPKVCPKDGLKAITLAALFGHAEMVSYLYRVIPLEGLSTDEWFNLLLATIEKRIYDVALKILEREPSLAKETGKKCGRQALRLLAEHDISNISNCEEALLRSLVRASAATPCLSWLKRICEQPLMRKRAWLLAKKLWDLIQKVEEADLFEKLINDPPILHAAAKVGNVGFITMLTSSDPDIIFRCSDEKLPWTMFHTAVSERQENVLRLFHQIGAMKDWIALSKCDKECNNILHLAAKLAPADRLKTVPGPALQMQRELMWFKEVEKIVPWDCRNAPNVKLCPKGKECPDANVKECPHAVNVKECPHAVNGKECPDAVNVKKCSHEVPGLTPRKLFSKQHEELLKDGEKWMKDTANYCMIVATLIATMVFAASITVPGGNNGEKGSPILLNRSFFTVFVGSDVTAMFFSTFSIIMFLSILTSRFQEDDFLVSLPKKLIFGLTALFLSIVSTMGAFTSTCFLLFTDQIAWITISVTAFPCFLLVFIFVFLHFRLWIDTVRSTYYSSYLLRPSSHSLFRNPRAKCRFSLWFAGCTCELALGS